MFFFFVDGPAGTGKTFLYRAMLADVRSGGNTAIAVTTSGVATSLLPGGQTAHSIFNIPINLDINRSCRVSKQSGHEMSLCMLWTICCKMSLITPLHLMAKWLFLEGILGKLHA